MSEPNVRLLVVTPLTMNPTASSRLPAVLKASAPIPRIGLAENPVCDGATDPGTSRPRSVKWRPFRGICCTVCRGDDVADGGRGAIDERRFRADDHGLAPVANRQAEVAHHRAADVDVQRLDDLCAKTGRLHA